MLGPYLKKITALEAEVHSLRDDVEDLREVKKAC